MNSRVLILRGDSHSCNRGVTPEEDGNGSQSDHVQLVEFNPYSAVMEGVPTAPLHHPLLPRTAVNYRHFPLPPAMPTTSFARSDGASYLRFLLPALFHVDRRLETFITQKPLIHEHQWVL